MGPGDEALVSGLLRDLHAEKYPAECKRILGEILVLLEKEIHRKAAILISRERRRYSLRPTDMLGALFLKVMASPIAPADLAELRSAIAAMQRNVLVDYARKRKARGDGLHDPLDVLERSQPTSHADTSFDEAIALAEAMEDLSPLQRQIVDFKYFQGCSWEETALYLGTSVDSARWQWQEVRRALVARRNRGRHDTRC